MRIIMGILGVLFGALHMAAGGFGLARGGETAPQGNSAVMLCGGFAVTCAAIAHLIGGHPGWVDGLAAAAGCMLACFAAYRNGKWVGKVHPIHHAVRISLASLIAVGFILW